MNHHRNVTVSKKPYYPERKWEKYSEHKYNKIELLKEAVNTEEVGGRCTKSLQAGTWDSNATKNKHPGLLEIWFSN